jgi:hypothetical protein
MSHRSYSKIIASSQLMLWLSNSECIGHPHQVSQRAGAHFLHNIARCTLMVISLIPSSVATCLFISPAVTKPSISCSRGSMHRNEHASAKLPFLLYDGHGRVGERAEPHREDPVRGMVWSEIRPRPPSVSDFCKFCLKVEPADAGQPNVKNEAGGPNIIGCLPLLKEIGRRTKRLDIQRLLIVAGL